MAVSIFVLCRLSNSWSCFSIRLFLLPPRFLQICLNYNPNDIIFWLEGLFFVKSSLGLRTSRTALQSSSSDFHFLIYSLLHSPNPQDEAELPVLSPGICSCSLSLLARHLPSLGCAKSLSSHFFAFVVCFLCNFVRCHPLCPSRESTAIQVPV